MSEIKLLPCPFCGFEYPEIETGTNGAKIICPKCGIGTEYIEDERDEMIYKGATEFREEVYIRIKHKTGAEIAVEKWNRRAGE